MSADNPVTLREALNRFAFRPGETFIRRWNWKAATLSACVRGSLFFIVNLKAGLAAATAALLLEAGFFILVAGFSGAMLQSLRVVKPAWKATLFAALAVPGLNHTVEIAMHTAHGTKVIAAGVIASISFSALSTTFNLFAMRRGLFIVGDDAAPLATDLRRSPRLILDFFLSVFRAVRRAQRKKPIPLEPSS